MNATKQYVKTRWVEILIPTVLSCSITLFGLWLGFKDADARELNRKIDNKAEKSDLDDVMVVLDSKADKEDLVSHEEKERAYIDGRIDGLHTLTQIELNSIKNTQAMQYEFNQKQFEYIIKSLDELKDN